MTMFLRNYFKKVIYLFVLIGFSTCFAGSYEDFFTAVQHDDVATVQRLLARGFDANTPDPQGQYGLLIALRQPSLKVARALIDAPRIDLNALSLQGESPLMLAAIKGQLELAERMLKKGADVNKTGWTALHYAASAGQVKLVSLLLEHHAYIDAESPNGSTPLMMASMYGSPEAVKLLLDEGADPMLKNAQGLTALQFAERANRVEAAALVAKAIQLQPPRPPGQW